VDSNAYLDKAEPFAADFLAGRAEDVDPGSRAPGAFQGVLMAVHVPEDVLYAVRGRGGGGGGGSPEHGGLLSVCVGCKEAGHKG
jgi:hypothetical protein